MSSVGDTKNLRSNGCRALLVGAEHNGRASGCGEVATAVVDQDGHRVVVVVDDGQILLRVVGEVLSDDCDRIRADGKIGACESRGCNSGADSRTAKAGGKQ